MAILQSVKEFFQSITIEPVVFLFQFGIFAVKGAQLPTNLLIWKICVMELGYPESVCNNLTLEENKDIESEVQKHVNHFQMTSQWLGSVPAVIFALIAGSLSDDFGRKPLIKWPMIGFFISSCLAIINYRYIRELPVEFFYFDELYQFFGGLSVYYLGMYGYGTDITGPAERAHRLARLDGSEFIAMSFGPLVSPLLFDAIGYYGCYTLRSVTTLSAVLYLTFLVKEPPKKPLVVANEPEEMSKEGIFKKIGHFFMTFIVDPFIKMLQTMFKKRPGHIRFLLMLQIIVYYLYWFSEDEIALTYLYMIRVFNSDGADYSLFYAIQNSFGVIGLFIVMPLISGKLKIHEALINVGISISVCIGLVIAAFAKRLFPEFYIGELLTFMRICQYAAARSIFTKTVAGDEVGKVFSAVAFFAALAPVTSNPAFRKLYNHTLDTFPSAFILQAAAIFLLLAIANLYLYTQRSQLQHEENQVLVQEEGTGKNYNAIVAPTVRILERGANFVTSRV